MADQAVTLTDERRDAGYDLLKLTDRVGFDAVGAGWGITLATQSWRFYLFTDMADLKGPLWVWERLLKAFSKLTLPEGITPLDIIVASPNEWLYRQVMVKMDDNRLRVGAVVSSEALSASGYGIDTLLLIRCRPERALLQEVAKKNSARRFDMKVRQLLAA